MRKALLLGPKCCPQRADTCISAGVQEGPGPPAVPEGSVVPLFTWKRSEEETNHLEKGITNADL